MQKARDRRNIFTTLLAALVVLSSASALGQAPITAPLFNVLDFSGDTGAFPLLEVQGGQTSSTLGIEVTSQSIVTTTAHPAPVDVIMGSGFGNLSLVQTGGLLMTSAGAGQGSPFLSMCAQQLTSTGINNTTTGYSCWNWQVLGGGNTADAPDVLNLTRTTQNTTGNYTLQVPDALNFAAGNSTLGGQLTIGSAPSSAADLTLKFVTVIGASTNNTTGGVHAKAGHLQLFPGFLNPAASDPDPNATEGALQIGMAVKGNQSDGLLACYTLTAQTAQACLDVKSPLLGVYFTVGMGSTKSSNGVIAPPGRAVVSSNDPKQWIAGTEVCRDPSHPSNAIASSGACPLGQAVGVAVGDPASTSSHPVDLNFSPQGVGSSGYWSAGPLNNGTGAGVTISPNGTETAYGFYITSEIVAGRLVLDVKTADSTADTYSFGIFDQTGVIVAHTAGQSFGVATITTIAFAEGTVTFTPGKYYFGYTGTGGNSTLTLVPYQPLLIPFAAQTVASGTGGVLVPFSPSGDVWVNSLASTVSFALAP